MAIIGAAFLSTFVSSITNSLNSDSTAPEPVKSSILKSVQSGRTGLNQDSSNSSKVSAAVQDKITGKFHKFTIDSSRQAIIYTSVFVSIWLVLSFALVGKEREE